MGPVIRTFKHRTKQVLSNAYSPHTLHYLAKALNSLLTYLLIFLSPAVVMQEDAFARSTELLVGGITTGATYGQQPRLGLDLSYLWGSCSDSCSGFGPSVGLINASTGEYFVGAALGAAYFGSVWVDASLRLKDSEVTGVYTTYGMG